MSSKPKRTDIQRQLYGAIIDNNREIVEKLIVNDRSLVNAEVSYLHYIVLYITVFVSV
jgi:hypothetical protein